MKGCAFYNYTRTTGANRDGAIPTSIYKCYKYICCQCCQSILTPSDPVNSRGEPSSVFLHHPPTSPCCIRQCFTAIHRVFAVSFFGSRWPGPSQSVLVWELCWNLSTMGDPAGIWNVSDTVFSITATPSCHSMTTERPVVWFSDLEMNPGPQWWGRWLLPLDHQCTSWWFNIYIYYKMITTVSLVIICHHTKLLQYY